ncbi:MAG: hypothetical protein ISR65_15620 [Bacteriovoracaceae bacterium]|nr:hypothetical protein [Bacteriovoracaceae bacterium]
MKKRLNQLTIYILFVYCFLPLSLYSKVDPPNYDFSLDSMKLFAPGTNLQDIKQKYGKGEVMGGKGDTSIMKYDVIHLRYKFPIFIQLYEDKVLDFFMTLPTYFLHDIFHQSLINRLGPQDKYLLKDRTAIYTWNSKSGFSHYYRGACTIVCFPMYYSGVTTSPPEELNKYSPLMIQFGVER